MHQSKIFHEVKKRPIANDEFYTPVRLAKFCINQCPIHLGQSVLDPAYGTGNFFNNFPSHAIPYYSKHFEKWNTPVDWVISNPPYSLLNKWWLTHTYEIAQFGFGYLIGQGNLTCKRMEEANAAGFGLAKIHMCKVYKWFGMSYFVVFQKNKPNLISFDRTVWK